MAFSKGTPGPSGSTKQCDECSGARKDAAVAVRHKGEEEHLWTELGGERLATSGTQLERIVRLIALFLPRLVQEHLIQHPFKKSFPMLFL